MTVINKRFRNIDAKTNRKETKKSLSPSLCFGLFFIVVSTFALFTSGQAQNTDVNTEYGLKNVKKKIFVKDKKKFTLAIHEMDFRSGAYGLFTFNRNKTADNHLQFYFDHYVVDVTPADASVIDSIKKTLTDDHKGEFPILRLHLPAQDLIKDSEIYVIGPKALSQIEGFASIADSVSFEAGADAITGVYNNGNSKMKLLLIEYYTPQTASDSLKKINEFVGKLTADEKAKIIVKRVGNYVVCGLDISDKAQADKVIGQIKYEQKVFWTGDKYTDIPQAYRPPDPLLVDEGKITANLIVGSFFGIGVMLLVSLSMGVLAGMSFFYIRRRKRRKLGTENMFVDPNVEIRLNLDSLPEEKNKAAIE